MQQLPWASLLECVEVQELEAFYHSVHALDGIQPAFPAAYPTSMLLGCVEVVDCLTVSGTQLICMQPSAGMGGIKERVGWVL